MTPSEVRELVMKEHEEFRRRMHSLNLALGRAGRGHTMAVNDLRAQILEFCSAAEAHMQLEEKHLYPVIERIDAWGPIRAQHMKEEHDAQRAALTKLRDEAQGGQMALFVECAKQFMTSFAADFAQEEKELLSPELLRDDAVSIDQVTE